jgi:hypothetical protein
VAIVRNLTPIKCAPGRHMSWTSPVPVAGYGMPVAGQGHAPVIVERKRFVNELPAARIQNQTTDLPIDASALLHERRPRP